MGKVKREFQIHDQNEVCRSHEDINNCSSDVWELTCVCGACFPVRGQSSEEILLFSASMLSLLLDRGDGAGGDKMLVFHLCGLRSLGCSSALLHVPALRPKQSRTQS